MAAQVAGARSHRRAAQQLAHWARLGRELEAAGGIAQRDIDRVLTGQLSYDELGDHDQAVVRTSWREGVDDDLPTLDLRSRFEVQGRSRWSEADAEGTAPRTSPPATCRPSPGAAPSAVEHAGPAPRADAYDDTSLDTPCRPVGRADWPA